MACPVEVEGAWSMLIPFQVHEDLPESFIFHFVMVVWKEGDKGKVF